MNTEKEHGNTSLMLSCPPKDKFDYALWISKENGGYICYLTGYSPIFDSWKSKKTATNLVNMGCVAVFYLASMCAIF